ncbi:Ornithine transporter of the mitochondrial inner membrane [Sugiyamaella lignohabitans]|uniref:Ornithine transporter of the mitochondrial inner membrane n=1 Tax=Sugiyamaella lignohabitans TaxID=796027 RepID=A0A161HFX5_9ASCO|nr:Ornithine transporter of the mitochondrial inner membrane [Sugiyamaella lignohabitans]ANB11551.1 Ornithine transporter of the mitochondrial inner membrane [Sugiyamaella lignohabitans]
MASENVQITNTIKEISLGSDTEHRKLVKLPQALIPYRLAICSYGAAMIATTVGFPLDSVKTRLQTHKFKSAWQCIVDTERHEGIRGFYRGLTAPLLSSSAVRSISITIYSKCVPILSNMCFSLYSAPKSKDTMAATIDWMLRTSPITFGAGAIAGSVCSIISCPFEFTKLASQIEVLVRRNQLATLATSTTTSQTQLHTPVEPAKLKPKGSFEVASELIKKGGVASLYGGYRYHICK